MYAMNSIAYCGTSERDNYHMQGNEWGNWEKKFPVLSVQVKHQEFIKMSKTRERNCTGMLEYI